MGCWNKTCAISNLPIRCGEPVVGIFLTNVPGRDPFEYHTPLPFYIEGNYDDYGRIEDETGVALDLLMETFKQKLNKFEQGENKYHDIAVDPATLTFGTVMEADHEDRLTFDYGNFRGTHTYNIHHVQIRKEVFDQIIEDYQSDIRKQDDKWSETRDFSDILADYPAFYQKLVKEQGTSMGRLLNSAFDDYDNYVGIMLKTGHDDDCGVMNRETVIRKLFESGMTEAEMYPFVENALKVSYINNFLANVHRQWQMPGYAGQEGETRNHTLLANIIIETSENMESFYEDEWDEEEELIETKD